MTRLGSIAIALILSVFGAIAYGAGSTEPGKLKAAACGSCHGEDGNSVTPTFPKLAGSHARYLQKQLLDFKEGRRVDRMMAPMAMGLDEGDMADISAYYASRKIISGNRGEVYIDEDEEVLVTRELIAQGKRVYLGGNKETGVPACYACHGKNGTGLETAGFPGLKGQHPAYTAKTLNDFRSGARGNDMSEMMRITAAKMTDNEINAVAAYVSSIK